jgi:hypothetical protein
MRRGIVAAVLPLVFFGALAAARADEVDAQGKVLLRGEPYKARLSAALWLSKRASGDGRATSLLAVALLRDKEKTVRHVAAVALGTLVGPDTPSGPRARALSALDKAAAADRDRKVRAAAGEALAAIRARLPAPEAELDGDGTGGLFLHLGPVGDPSGRLPGGGASKLEAAVRAALESGGGRGAVSQAGAALPSRADLRTARQRGFYLGAAVASLETRPRGSAVEIRCRVTLRVTAWGGHDGGERLDESRTASASGSGEVIAAQRGVERAKVDCVTAVGEEIIVRQVVPFLRRFDGSGGGSARR